MSNLMAAEQIVEMARKAGAMQERASKTFVFPPSDLDRFAIAIEHDARAPLLARIDELERRLKLSYKRLTELTKLNGDRLNLI